MKNKRMILALAAIGAALVLAVVLISTQRDKSASWKAEVEGFLAIATPCCTRASLWDSLDTVTSDGQRARPVSVAEATQWLNEWPYRSREDDDRSREEQVSVALQSSEVRCAGPATGGEISRDGTDEETLERIRQRRECVYAKWKVWSEETADETPNERHTVWVDEDGFFHGRVDYWQ